MFFRKASLRDRDTADSARDRRAWDVAAVHYGRHLANNPDDVMIWVQLGHAEKERGNKQAAIEAYQRAWELSPSETDIHFHLGDILKQAGRFEDALKVYEAAIATAGKDASTRFRLINEMQVLGDAARDRRDWHPAATIYSRYLEIATDDVAIWVQYGHAEKERGNLPRAREAYERARDLSPSDSDIHRQLGHTLTQLGENRAALEAYETALRLNPATLGLTAEIEALVLRIPELLSARVAPDVREALTPYFDVDFYLMDNPDVAASGVEPLAHYHIQGWHESRNPCRNFDTAYYLATNSDVANAGLNPFLHWIWAGRAEGRLSAPVMDVERRQLRRATSPRARARDWGGAADLSAPISVSMLHNLLDTSVGIVISISHDDYVKNSGGVQNLMGDEARGLTLKGWTYLHLSPAAPLPVLAPEQAIGASRLTARLDGRHLGVTTAGDLKSVLRDLHRQGVRTTAIVHHLMGHVPEHIVVLIEAAGIEQAIVWVHDFFTICGSYALMRNDVVYCGGPPPQSNACSICCYGPERTAHQRRMTAFFEALKPTVYAPSQIAFDIWQSKGHLPYAEMVIQPIAQLYMAPSGAIARRQHGRPLRVAHLGARVFHKGWHVFEELALNFAQDVRYEFLQLGVGDGPPLPGCIRHVEVRVTPDNRDAMVEAIAGAEIDIVIAWSLWPETFSFTVHEALAGGAFVIVRRAAGNMWPAVARNSPNQGCPVETEDELFALFAGTSLAGLTATSRQRGALVPGVGTADFLPSLLEENALSQENPSRGARLADRTKVTQS